MRKEDNQNPFDSLDSGHDVQNEVDFIMRQDSAFSPEKEPEIKPQEQEQQEQEEAEDQEGLVNTQEGDDPEGSENEGDDTRIEVEGNVLPIFAKRWKEEGRLPEDFEIGEDLTEEALNDALYEHTKKTSYAKLRTELLEEIIEKEGLTPDSIAAAKRIFGGVDDENVQKEIFYRNIASVRLDPESNDYEQSVKELGMMYHMDRGFDQEKAANYMEYDLAENTEKAVEEYKTYFKAKALEIKNHNEELEASKIAKRNKDKVESLLKQETWLEKGEINGTRYTKEQMSAVKRALFERTELVTDSEGNQRLVTLEQKKILESRMDPEKAFQARVNFVLGYSPTEAKQDAEIRAKSSLAKDLGKLIKRVPKVDMKSTPQQQKAQTEAVEKELF